MVKADSDSSTVSSRRSFLSTSGTALAVISTATLPALAAAADPILAVWEEWQRIDKEHAEVCAAIRPIYDQLLADGMLVPCVQIGTYWQGPLNPTEHPGSPIYAYSVDKIPNVTGADQQRYAKRLAAFRRSEIEVEEARDRTGLTALQKRQGEIEERKVAVEQAMMDMPATTLPGLLAKLRYLSGFVGDLDAQAAPDDEADWEVRIMRRVLASAEHLAGEVVR